MMTWLRLAAITAQTEWWHKLRLRSTTSTSSMLWALASLACVVVAVWIASRWFQMREHRRTHSPRALFRELCHAHGLSSNERNLLLRLAAQQSPYNPASIFLEPQRFEVDQLVSINPVDAQYVEQLREKLFGSSVGATDAVRR